MPPYVFNVYSDTLVTPPASLAISTSSVPSAVQGQEYTLTFEGTGGTTPYTWDLVAPNNSLPPGMNFTNGVLAGTPSTAGAYPLNFRLTDNVGTIATTGVLNFQVAVPGVFTVTTNSLPAVTRGNGYSTTFASSNGNGAVTWSLVSPYDSLPTGLNLTSTGISGIPTVAGSTTIKIRATDSTLATADSGLLTLTVNQVAVPVITTASPLPIGRNGVAYSRKFIVTNGWAPFTWAKPTGTFPTGITLNTSDGTLSGTTTVEGTYNFTITATDSEGRVATKAFDFVIQAAGAVELANDYFVTQAAHPTTVTAVSFRDPAHVLAKANGGYVKTPAGQGYNTWKYVYGSDTYHTPQDGARVAMPHSLSDDQLYVPYPANTISGKMLTIFDFWWGPEFKTNLDTTGLPLQHKAFQLRDAGKKNSGGAIYTEARMMYRPNTVAPIIGYRDLRTYGGPISLKEWGIVTTTPYDPSGAGAYDAEAWQQKSGKWVRHIFEFKLDVPGTEFSEYKSTTAIGQAHPNPIGTKNLISSATDGAGGTILEVENWQYADPKGITQNGWLDETTIITNPITVTISGHSNAALNGKKTAYCIDSTHLRLAEDVGATTGTGGQVSKHFHMFTWWQMEEDEEMFRMFYKVPIMRRGGSGRLVDFNVELNTSVKIDSVQGFYLTTAPSVGATSVITTPAPHGLVTNDFIHMSRCSSVPTGMYNITVTGADTFTIPYNVTTVANINPVAQPAVQEVDFGDIGAGSSFTLRWTDGVSGVINFASDMSNDIRLGLIACGMKSNTTVTKLYDHVYSCEYHAAKTNLIVVTPTGFTPGESVITEAYQADSLYAGTFGRVTKGLVGYLRNVIFQKDRDIDESIDVDLFKKPVA